MASLLCQSAPSTGSLLEWYHRDQSPAIIITYHCLVRTINTCTTSRQLAGESCAPRSDYTGEKC
eukprot:4792503-Prymnesium_polylepis.1